MNVDDIVWIAVADYVVVMSVNSMKDIFRDQFELKLTIRSFTTVMETSGTLDASYYCTVLRNPFIHPGNKRLRWRTLPTDCRNDPDIAVVAMTQRLLHEGCRRSDRTEIFLVSPSYEAKTVYELPEHRLLDRDYMLNAVVSCRKVWHVLIPQFQNDMEFVNACCPVSVKATILDVRNIGRRDDDKEKINSNTNARIQDWTIDSTILNCKKTMCQAIVRNKNVYEYCGIRDDHDIKVCALLSGVAMETLFNGMGSAHHQKIDFWKRIRTQSMAVSALQSLILPAMTIPQRVVDNGNRLTCALPLLHTVGEDVKKKIAQFLDYPFDLLCALPNGVVANLYNIIVAFNAG